MFGYATFANMEEVLKWSRRKCITQDWYAARSYSRHALHNATVLVDSRAFEYPFFYTMWSSYFLDDSRIVFSRDFDGGGYLRIHLQQHQEEWNAPPRTKFVSVKSPPIVVTNATWQRANLAFVAPLPAVRRDDLALPDRRR